MVPGDIFDAVGDLGLAVYDPNVVPWNLRNVLSHLWNALDHFRFALSHLREGSRDIRVALSHFRGASGDLRVVRDDLRGVRDGFRLAPGCNGAALRRFLVATNSGGAEPGHCSFTRRGFRLVSGELFGAAARRLVDGAIQDVASVAHGRRGDYRPIVFHR